MTEGALRPCDVGDLTPVQLNACGKAIEARQG